MKIYIAGKITDEPNYFEKFREAEDELTAQGHIVLNPADLPEGMEKKDYMKICFAMIDVADSVVLLENYEDSSGARLEVQYCKYINKHMWRFNDGKDYV